MVLRFRETKMTAICMQENNPLLRKSLFRPIQLCFIVEIFLFFIKYFSFRISSSNPGRYHAYHLNLLISSEASAAKQETRHLVLKVKSPPYIISS